MTVLEVHQVSKFYGSREVLSGLSFKVQKGDMEKIDRPVLDRRRIDPSFVPGQGSGKIALELRGYHREVGGRTLFEQVDFLLQSGQRAGLLGANGTGKSTLFKDVVAHAAWDHPVIRIGPRIRLGYYAQEHETLNPAHTILEEVCRVGNLNRDQGFAALSKFLFGWGDLDKQVGDLSGGEKSRVQLAKLMVSGANLLLLDEPTNHLDIASREEVEAALDAFEGTLLVISHDRYFLDKIAERIVEVEDMDLVVHAGNFSDFWAQRQAIGEGPEGEVVERIEVLEAEKMRLEQALGAAFDARNFKRGERCSRKLRQVEQQIEALYEALEREK